MMKRLDVWFALLLLVGAYTAAVAQDQWNWTTSDAAGDAASAYDITQTSAWHDGTTFHVKIILAGQYSTGPYTVYGARIRSGSAIYGLAFVTESYMWGPKLGVSYDGGASWGFAGGSPSGSISPTEVNLQVPMANLGPRPWTVDIITGVWWYFNNYQIMDSTSTTIVPSLVTVSNVVVRQRTDGSRLVDIYYDLLSPVVKSITISATVSDNSGSTYSITPVSVSGDVGPNVPRGTGKHIIWNAGTDLPGAYGKDYQVRLTATY